MTRMINIVTAGLVALSVMSAGAAAAVRIDGKQLLSLCTANMDGRGNPMAAAECMGFVVGVADTFDCTEDVHGLKWNPAQSASQPQLVKLVIRHLQSDPKALTAAGHMAVAEALSVGFPCSAKTAGN